MQWRATATLGVAATLAVMLGVVALPGCGGGDDDERQEELCEVCSPDPDRDCLNQCLRFCDEDETAEECEARCRIECDECKADLACAPCAGECTGAAFRCAPAGATTACADGRF